MPGDNQHFIPKHVLKGFAIRESPKFAWEYRIGAAPEQKRIKKLAAAYQFYSETREDGGATLDDEITDYEDGLARRISALRNNPPGALDNSTIAAEIVAHLSFRNDNLRGSLTYGVKLMIRRTFGLVGEEGGMRQLLGLEGTEPSKRFKELAMRPILEHPDLRRIGLPEAVMTRVAFGLAREHLPTTFDSPALRMIFARLHEDADSFVRRGHNQALAKSLVPDARAATLAQLSWSVVETPFNIILPDCVAIGITSDGEVRALFLTETDVLATVAMALSSNRLLVGQGPNAASFDPLLFNLHAIACCEQFFVSGIVSAQLTEWSRYIGVRARTVLQRGVAEAFTEFAPPIVPPSAAGPTIEAKPRLAVEPAPAPSYAIHFLGCADQPTAQRIAEAVCGVITGIDEIIPLARLDGITFAADYPAALANLDRGFEASTPLSTTDEPGVVGVAMAPTVLRDGIVKAHIVMRSYLGHALVGDDEPAKMSAIQVLVQQLAEVGCVELFDQAMPGVMLHPIGDPFHALRYRHVDRAWSGYFAARVSAVFAPDVGEDHRTLLIAALKRAAQEIPQLRLDYRFHGDVPRLMDAVLERVGYILVHGARLIGHYDGLNDAAMDAEGTLASELSKLRLDAWFNLYRRDLRVLWERRGEWVSLEEFMSLGHHVERLPWQFGLFLWQAPDGSCRLEAPLHVDAARLRVEAWKRPLRTAATVMRNFGRRIAAAVTRTWRY